VSGGFGVVVVCQNEGPICRPGRRGRAYEFVASLTDSILGVLSLASLPHQIATWRLTISFRLQFRTNMNANKILLFGMGLWREP
jgi:hypothetical protein